MLMQQVIEAEERGGEGWPKHMQHRCFRPSRGSLSLDGVPLLKRIFKLSFIDSTGGRLAYKQYNQEPAGPRSLKIVKDQDSGRAFAAVIEGAGIGAVDRVFRRLIGHRVPGKPLTGVDPTVRVVHRRSILQGLLDRIDGTIEGQRKMGVNRVGHKGDHRFDLAGGRTGDALLGRRLHVRVLQFFVHTFE